MNKHYFTSLFGVLFLMAVTLAGTASASDNEIAVDYIISPDTLMLNSKAPYFAVEINNTSTDFPGYSIRDINPDSVHLWIETTAGSKGLGALDPVKENPEINIEYDKLVLMYYREDLYSAQINEDQTVLEYLKDVSASGTGEVDFKITGNLNDGTPLRGDAFTVDVMQNKQGGK